MAPRPLRFALMVLLATVGLAAVAGAAEFAYRVRSARSGRSVQVRYYNHRRLDRALVRDTDYEGVVHINRLGFRGPDFDPVKTPGVTRVIVVGASTTFDPCVASDRETWAARLEYWLGELAPDRRFQVINAGVSGFTMDQHVIRLHTELYALQPDVIVMYAGHGIVSAEGEVESKPTRPDEAPVMTPWGRWLERNSRLYPALQARWQPDAERDIGTEEWARAVDEAEEDFRRDLTSFVLIARGFGAQVVLVEINRLTGSRSPSEFNATERAAWERAFATPPEVVDAGYQRFRIVWRDVAQSAGARFIPADSLGIAGAEHYCDGDPIHFSTAGSEAMGKRLAERLLSQP